MLILISCITYGFTLPAVPALSSSAAAHSIPWPKDINYNYANSLWPDMRDNFQLQDDTYRPEVQQQIKWLQTHQEYLYQMLESAGPYIYYVYQQTRSQGLPAELALLPFIESQYDPFAYSTAGAVGLWQMMPGTASGFGLKINWWYDGRRDVITSTHAALDYLTYLYNFFDENWQLAIAAYDSGEGTVLNALRHNEQQKIRTDFWNLPLPQETHSYLPKLLALAAVIDDPSRYGINLPPIPNYPYFAAVNVHSQIDIHEAANLANVDVKLIRHLNPGFRRWATDPDGPYTLLIPADKTKLFEQRLAKLPKSKRVTWRHYIVKKGDILGEITKRFHTKLSIVKQVNNLKSYIIHPQQSLLIPESFHGSIHSHILKERGTIAEVNIPGPQRDIYIVKLGDNLWTIAKKFNLKIQQIRFWNNLTPKHHVQPGESLILWVQKIIRHDNNFGVRIYNYTVKPGDTLSTIANKFHTRVNEIKKRNNLKNDIIRDKQVLKFPIKTAKKHESKREIYIVRPNDSIIKIAKRFGIKPASIAQWNHLKNAKLIHPKQRLVIYR